jgi:hypothetical protein
MASSEKQKLVKAIAPVLKLHGFKKKSATWHRQRDGFIQTFNVQGSQWSKSFYLNLGIYVTAIGGLKTPAEYDCHIRNRVGDVVGDLVRYNELLDFENEVEDDQRFDELQDIVEQYAIKWLDKYANSAMIVDWISGGQTHGLPVSKAVFDFYGVEQPLRRTNR